MSKTFGELELVFTNGKSERRHCFRWDEPIDRFAYMVRGAVHEWLHDELLLPAIPAKLRAEF